MRRRRLRRYDRWWILGRMLAKRCRPASDDAHRPRAAEKVREEMHMPGTDNIDADSSKGAGGATSEQPQAALPVSMTEEQLRAVTVGEIAPLVGHIQIVD